MLPTCPHCHSIKSLSDSRKPVIFFGHFLRRCDGTLHQRFRCRPCGKTFSTATRELCYRQKKRHLNSRIFESFVSGMSQRRLALILQVNRKTVVRKFIFLFTIGKVLFEQDRRAMVSPVMSFQFDDLETSEHSKLKPLAIGLAIETNTRRILGFKVAKMPAKGLLAKKSLKKYGRRKDERRAKRCELFAEIAPFIHEKAEILSDENPHYAADLKEFFKGATHRTFKGRKARAAGLGELKQGGPDPIFSLNHSCAMTRANINRLFRRTWNTTKRIDRLEMHLTLYALFHNVVLLAKPSRTY